MTKFRRKERNNSANYIIQLFVGTALMVSLFFVASSIYINEEPLKGDSKTKTANDIPRRPLILKKPKKHRVKDPIADVSPKKDTKTSALAEPNYHIVFSTDCSGYQKWQSYLLFYSAYKVQQPGTITRIASGCTEEEEAIEREFHSDISQHMSSNFKLHLTPRFSKVKDENGETTNKKYEYFNKPFGLLHWIEHSEEKIMDDDIVILLDPDQVLTRKITNDFSNQAENLLFGDNPKTIVTHGSPFAQKYGFGAQWQNLDIEKVTGTKDSPAKNVSRKDAFAHYPVGPPYLATARDMHLIARTWAEFVPRSHKEHPHLMAEMYAYCIAAAHLELPHQIVRSLMVSSVDGGTGERSGEGWKLVQAIDDEQICSPTVMVDNILPSVIHYCQRYILGKHFFGKRRMPKDIFSCESPLLSLPAQDVANKYDYYVPPAGTYGEKKELNGNSSKQTAFMVCALTRLVNEASSFYQSKNCETPKDAHVEIDLWSGKVMKKQ
jgi:hypothetical protein